MSLSVIASKKHVKPRSMKFDFKEGVPLHWVRSSPFFTAFGNSFNLLFPEAEHYFARSVKPFLGQIKNPSIKADAKGFIGQESNHARQHTLFWDIMEGQGIKIKPFLTTYVNVVHFLEGILSPKMKLAVTAALEHYTAMLAENAFNKQIFYDTHPVMKDLFLWHCAEEIEHKAAAFDVLMSVDDSYALRITGYILGTALLGSFTAAGIVYLLNDENQLWNPKNLKDIHEFFLGGDDMLKESFFTFLEYFKFDFHPDQKDNYHLAENYFELRNSTAG